MQEKMTIFYSEYNKKPKKYCEYLILGISSFCYHYTS